MFSHGFLDRCFHRILSLLVLIRARAVRLEYGEDRQMGLDLIPDSFASLRTKVDFRGCKRKVPRMIPNSLSQFGFNGLIYSAELSPLLDCAGLQIIDLESHEVTASRRCWMKRPGENSCLLWFCQAAVEHATDIQPPILSDQVLRLKCGGMLIIQHD